MEPNGLLYFAYGADMNPRVMKIACPGAEVLGVARLDDYRIDFFDRSRAWDGGEAAPMPAPGAALWGVLYTMSKDELDRLDEIADAREDGTGARFRYPVKVVDARGAERDAFLYKKDQVVKARPPSTEFLALLVEGAEARGLPADYVADLRTRESHPAAYPVPAPSLRNGRPVACVECADASAAHAAAKPGGSGPGEAA